MAVGDNRSIDGGGRVRVRVCVSRVLMVGASRPLGVTTATARNAAGVCPRGTHVASRPERRETSTRGTAARASHTHTHIHTSAPRSHARRVAERRRDDRDVTLGAESGGEQRVALLEPHLEMACHLWIWVLNH